MKDFCIGVAIAGTFCTFFSLVFGQPTALVGFLTLLYLFALLIVSVGDRLFD